MDISFRCTSAAVEMSGSPSKPAAHAAAVTRQEDFGHVRTSTNVSPSITTITPEHCKYREAGSRGTDCYSSDMRDIRIQILYITSVPRNQPYIRQHVIIVRGVAVRVA